MREVIAWLVCLALATGLAPLHGQGVDSISVEERAQIINELVAIRSDQIQDSIPFGACELYVALGREPGFRERLRPWVLERIVGEIPSACDRRTPEYTRDPAGWYFVSMRKTDPNTLIVRARVAPAREGSYQMEQYTFCRQEISRIGRRWELRKIEISSFGFEMEELWRVPENRCPPPGLDIDMGAAPTHRAIFT